MTQYTIITTFSDKNHTDYAYRFLKSAANFNCPVICYVDKLYVPTKNVTYKILDIPDLVHFRERHIKMKPRSFLEDARRFSFKSYVMCEASKELTGRMIWLDADCICDTPMSNDIWDSVAPANEPVSHLGRQHSYSETGFVMFDLDNPITRTFINDLREIYNSDFIFKLIHFTDCHAIDYLIKKHGGLNLTPSAKGMDHCFLDAFGEWMDHTKGGRKSLGESPERIKKTPLVESSGKKKRNRSRSPKIGPNNRKKRGK